MKLIRVLALVALSGFVAPVFADGTLVVLPRQILIDQNGAPRAGAKLYTYQAGTTTPLTTYTTKALSVPLSNPVLSLGNGLFPAIYADPAGGDYKIVVKDSADVTIYTEDNLSPVAPIDSTAILQTVNPRTALEIAAGVTPVNYAYAECVVNRYGNNTAPGETDMTSVIQATFNLCAADSSTPGSSDPILSQRTVRFLAQDYLTNTVVVPGSMIIQGEGWATRILPGPTIPDGGAIFLSLSGTATSGGDETTNLALLTSIYGSGSEPARRREYDLSGMQVRDLLFYAAPVRHVSAIWFTGFTQDARIFNVRTRGLTTGTGFDGGAIRLNGSWVWSMANSSLYGESLSTKEGIGIGLGGNSGGTHLGATSCNSFSLTNNRILQFSRGIAWRRGSVATITGNDLEFNTISTNIQAGKNFTYSNYHESDDSRSIELGGTGTGEDNEVRAANIVSNLFNETSDNSTERIKVRNVQYSHILGNEFKGTGTEDITLDTGSENAAGNEIEASSFSKVVVQGSGAQRVDDNVYRYQDLPPRPRALVRLSGDLSIANDTLTTISWSTEDTDVGGWFVIGSPTLLTVPSGVHKVRLVFYTQWDDNSTGYRLASLLKGGSTSFVGRAEDRRAASNTTRTAVASPVIPVTAGDTFSLQVRQTSGGALNLIGNNGSYLAIEAVD